MPGKGGAATGGVRAALTGVVVGRLLQRRHPGLSLPVLPQRTDM